MEKLQSRQVKILAPELREALMFTLVHRGRVAAMKLYKEQTQARLDEAKNIVEKLAREVEPGQALACHIFQPKL